VRLCGAPWPGRPTCQLVIGPDVLDDLEAVPEGHGQVEVLGVELHQVGRAVADFPQAAEAGTQGGSAFGCAFRLSWID
jgi:hypothetical protein